MICHAGRPERVKKTHLCLTCHHVYSHSHFLQCADHTGWSHTIQDCKSSSNQATGHTQQNYSCTCIILLLHVCLHNPVTRHTPNVIEHRVVGWSSQTGVPTTGLNSNGYRHHRHMVAGSAIAMHCWTYTYLGTWMLWVSTSLRLPIITSTCTCCSDTTASGTAAGSIAEGKGVRWGLNFQLESTEHVMPLTIVPSRKSLPIVTHCHAVSVKKTLSMPSRPFNILQGGKFLIII